MVKFSRSTALALLLKRHFLFKEEEVDEKNRPLVNILGITTGVVFLVEGAAIFLSAPHGPEAGIRFTAVATALVAVVGSWARLQAHGMPDATDTQKERRWLLDGFGKGVNFLAGMATVAFAIYAVQVV